MVSLLFIAGCATNSNDSVATYRAVGNGYEVTVSGRRENMAHGPLTYLFRGTSPSSRTFLVPRISGDVLGTDIPVEEGYYRLVGTIHFSGRIMNINLEFDDTDRNRRRPIPENGQYTLREVGK